MSPVSPDSLRPCQRSTLLSGPHSQTLFLVESQILDNLLRGHQGCSGLKYDWKAVNPTLHGQEIHDVQSDFGFYDPLNSRVSLVDG